MAPKKMDEINKQAETTKSLKQRLVARQSTAELNRKAAKARRKSHWTVEDYNSAKRNAEELCGFFNYGLKL